MKSYSEARTVRLNCKIRADIKEAMEDLLAKWQLNEGAYLSLGMVFARAARILLAREGIAIGPEPLPKQPEKKPVKTLVPNKRRKITAGAA